MLLQEIIQRSFRGPCDDDRLLGCDDVYPGTKDQHVERTIYPEEGRIFTVYQTRWHHIPEGSNPNRLSQHKGSLICHVFYIDN